jgi:signal transduction histidine kinase
VLLLDALNNRFCVWLRGLAAFMPDPNASRKTEKQHRPAQTHSVDVYLNSLANGSEMGTLIREFDWSATPLGAIESWSPALRTMVRFLLANRFPLLLWWGPQYVSIYNDPYRPVLGTKHPWALGRPVSECWQEIWEVLKPLIDTPYHGGPATWNDDIFLEVKRYGFLEETHFTIAYSPVPDESVLGGIGGVLATVHEITEKVIGERRILALRDLAARLAETKSVEETCAAAAETLARHDKDLPFTLIYRVAEEGSHAHLAGASGVIPGRAVSPLTVSLHRQTKHQWPLASVKESGTIQIIGQLRDHFDCEPPSGPWSDPPNTAVVVPVFSGNDREVSALLVAGVSSRLRWDEAYAGFLELVSTQLGSAIANARAYEEEKKRAEALAELDRAKTIFFSNVSHEFRTPLTLILAPLQDALAETNQPRERERLELLQRNALRLQKLVNNLLDFSRIEAGRIRASFEPTDLTALTTELASVFRSAIEKAGMRLIVDCRTISEPVYVDRDMYEKIVLNLLSNAFKFTFEGEIEVRLEERHQVVEVSVRDTGAGMTEEQVLHLFERFYRIEGVKARTHEGTGIGLALVKELVQLHGGEVKVRSAPDQGSVFTVTIPKGKAHIPGDQIGLARGLLSTALGPDHFLQEALRWLGEESSPPLGAESSLLLSEQPILEQAGSRPSLVWADDNADMRDYVRKLLSPRLDVRSFSDGEAALAAIRCDPPDLVLADIMMPRLDGFGLIQAIRADPSTQSIPVILLSARAGEEARVEGLQAGADDYLVKPFSARELVGLVEAHLKLSQLRKESAAALDHRSQQLEMLLQAAPLGIYLIDAEFRIAHVNPIARAVFEDVPGGVLGRDFGEVSHILWDKNYADEIGQIFRHTLATGESYVVPEAAEFRIDRNIAEYYEWRIDRITLPDGRFGIVCCFRDISQQVQARKLIEQNRDALRESDRRKDEFLAVLAHELRNPLAPIRTALHLLRMPDVNRDTVNQMYEIMERQLVLLVRLVDDLMQVSRITRGKIELRKQRVELTNVVQRAVETSRPVIDAAQHQLTIRLPKEPVTMDGDPIRLAQVLSNLLNNAAKYTAERGHIWLSAWRENPQVVISVRDNGTGIPVDMLAQVFDLFTQIERGYSRAQGGLGIGLTLVRSLVEMHGGRVEAKSAGPGLGSEFLVRLPLAPEEAASPDDQNRPSQQVTMSARRILVVDDNRDSAESLSMFLKSLGADVWTVNDGQAALEALESINPSVLFLDIGMPGIDGYELARRVRNRHEHSGVTLIALSGWGYKKDLLRSKQAGIDHHLVKPADPELVRRLLATLPP